MQQYAILCYDDERVVGGWSEEEDAAVMARLAPVHKDLATAGQLAAAGRLEVSGAGRVVAKGAEAPVTDGPFAETKEQLLGFYVVTVEAESEAVEAARALARASTSSGHYEVRPLRLFRGDGGPP